MKTIKIGVFLSLLGMFFGLGLGISFGVAEDSYKESIQSGIAAHPQLHDAKSSSKIWRYVQRAHFHAMGVAAITGVMLLLLQLGTMTSGLKTLTATLIGLGNAYPLSWYMMYQLSPSLGRHAAHSHWLTETFTYIGVGSLVLGSTLLVTNLFLGMFSEP